MRKICLCLALIIYSNVLFLSGCQTNPTKAPEVLAEFEYSSKTNFVFLPVELNGQIYQFILDTGASGTFFSDSLKSMLGKPLPIALSIVLADGSTVKGEVFHTPDANIGPLKLNVIPSINVAVSSGGLESEMKGTIGIDFLRKYIVQIDYDNKKVTFFKGKKEFDLFSLFKPKENRHPEWGEPIPLHSDFKPECNYYVKGSFYDDIETNFVIDSGWGLPYDVIDSNVLKRIESRMTQEINDGNVPPYLIVPMANDYKMIENITFDNLEFKDYLVKENPYSVLGQEFLSRHIVTFDFPNKIMYLKKGKNYNTQPNIYMPIGMTGCVVNSRDYVVEKVDPNSSAYKKGIRVKDILVKVNNENIQYMGITEFMKYLIEVPVTNEGKLPFTFKRGEEIFTVEFIKKAGQR